MEVTYPVFPGPALSNLKVEVTGTVIRFVTVADTTRVDDGRSDAGTRTLSLFAGDAIGVAKLTVTPIAGPEVKKVLIYDVTCGAPRD